MAASHRVGPEPHTAGGEHRCSEPPPGAFRLRAASYLHDRAKRPASEPPLRLRGAQMFRADGGAAECVAAAVAQGLPADGRSLVIRFVLPAGEAETLHVLLHFAGDGAAAPPFADRFWDDAVPEATEALWRERLKIVPLCPEGPWVVRKAVGTPALVAKRIRTEVSFVRPGAVEVCLHVGESAAAARIFRLVRSFAGGTVVDLGFTLEGRSDDELPEALLAAVRFQRIQLDRVPLLPETGAPVAP